MNRQIIGVIINRSLKIRQDTKKFVTV